MTDTAAASAGAIPADELWGHPKGLYVCFTTELWERFSFYGMKYLLVLYLTKYHLFTDQMGLDVLGSYAGLVYALPLIGGMLADRYLGMRKSVVFGGTLLSMGHILMAVEGYQAVFYAAGSTLVENLTLASGQVLLAGTVLAEDITIRDTAALNVFYLALALIVMGVGYLKPNISTIVGQLYSKDDPRRDGGFTIFYMGINIGSFTATLLCGWLGETFGWKYGFGAAGIGMIIGLTTFLYGQKFLHGLADPSEPEKLKKSVVGPVNVEHMIYLLTLPAIAVAWWLVQHEHIVLASQNVLLIVSIVGLILYSMVYDKQKTNNTVAYSIAGIAVVSGIYAVLVNLHFIPGSEAFAENVLYGSIALIVGFVVYGFRTHNSAEFGRTVVLMILILSTVVFWALFEQSAGSMTFYADRVVDRTVGDTTFTAAQFGSLNAGFIMLLAIPFAMLWTWLAKRELEPATPVKFGLGIVQVGLGFGMLILGAKYPDAAGQVSMIWLILAYLLHTTGELCLSPVGLSAVTKLSIGKVVGVSMGTWFLATALSETVATRIGRLAAIDTPRGEVVDVAAALAKYTELYGFLMWLGIGTGVFMLLISPILKRWMHGTH
ncbi:MAG: peptide MFS transporter [Gammaproteobacteria bacterium]|nr:peptide MFS transporter [Gammaproteobacteria bacterium]MDH5240546.1 peptide MFS transporter [Gammaproteobacteria bacterium]MDH5261685.1 peptide MFS transporter [Gammaproteobacteria bacterium]MDH5584443.1 peptide MFS transporter [Gammaproteobacteria bacterium]